MSYVEVAAVSQWGDVTCRATTKETLDSARSQTRVNVGVAFQQWRQLREQKSLKKDTMVQGFVRPP
uniref:Uncharacterized protein n=1 Tax=Seriola lalandi dorsalis TaxID=1841481 RepID=A0A3B4XVK4_SERLL